MVDNKTDASGNKTDASGNKTDASGNDTGKSPSSSILFGNSSENKHDAQGNLQMLREIVSVGMIQIVG